MRTPAPFPPNRDMQRARWQKGMSIAVLACEANLSPKHIRQIERGYAWPREDTAKTIADVLGADVLDRFPLERLARRKRLVAA